VERGGGGGELDQSHWTLLSAEDIFCGHHPTLHLGDQHSVLEQLWVVEVNRVLWSGARSVGANARVPH